ncbi:hypothetical protein HY440_02545 [Candidatus Microgenomates bacterium]|nr:hypothetical protein [Candidatus Microgenomates bacterium]
MWPNLITIFNQLLSTLILFFWSFLPKPTHLLTTPTAKLEKTASTSAIVSMSDTSAKSVVTPSVPWGTTEKLGDGLYRTYVGNDSAMGTPAEILTALNVYRKNHGVGEVKSDENICKLALWRAQVQQKLENLDGHQGLKDYMADPKHWQELDVKSIGENASYGYVLSGTHLIEWVFDSDVEHRDNQLNPSWNLACAGTSGVTVDIIFGQR